MNIFASLKALFQPAGPVDGTAVTRAPTGDGDAGFAAIMAGMDDAPSPLMRAAGTVMPDADIPMADTPLAPDDAPVAQQPAAKAPVDVAASLTRFIRRAGDPAQTSVARPPLPKPHAPALPAAAPAIARGEDEPAASTTVDAPLTAIEDTPVREQPVRVAPAAQAPPLTADAPVDAASAQQPEARALMDGAASLTRLIRRASDPAQTCVARPPMVEADTPDLAGPAPVAAPSIARGEDQPAAPAPVDAPVVAVEETPLEAPAARPAASPVSPLAAAYGEEDRPAEPPLDAAEPVAATRQPAPTPADPAEPVARPAAAPHLPEAMAAEEAPVARQPIVRPLADAPASPLAQAVEPAPAPVAQPLPMPVDDIAALPVEPPIAAAPAAAAAQPAARPARHPMPIHAAPEYPSVANDSPAALEPSPKAPAEAEGADESDRRPADESPVQAAEAGSPSPPVIAVVIPDAPVPVAPQTAESVQILPAAPPDPVAPAPVARASAARLDPVAPAPVAPSAAHAAPFAPVAPAPDAPSPDAIAAPPAPVASPLSAPAAPEAQLLDQPLPASADMVAPVIRPGSRETPVSPRQRSAIAQPAPQRAATMELVNQPVPAPTAAPMALAAAPSPGDRVMADALPHSPQPAMPHGDAQAAPTQTDARLARDVAPMIDNKVAVAARSPAQASPKVAPSPATDAALMAQRAVSTPATPVAAPVQIAQTMAGPVEDAAPPAAPATTPPAQDPAEPLMAPAVAPPAAPEPAGAKVAPAPIGDVSAAEPSAASALVAPSAGPSSAPVPARPMQPLTVAQAPAKAPAKAPAPLPVIDLSAPTPASPPAADASPATPTPEMPEQPAETPVSRVEASPARAQGPIRSEVVSLLQLVRDRMSGRTAAPANPAPATPLSSTEKVVATADSAGPASVAATPVPAMPVAAQPAPAAPVTIMPAAPTPDLNAVLTGQVVDMGLDGQWIDGLARDIAGLARDGAQGRFQINAPHLGPVDIAIRQGSDGAQVTLGVATEAAEVALKQDSDRLRADSALSAVRIADVKVERQATSASDGARGDQGSGQSAGQPAFSQQQGGSNQGHHAQSLAQSMGQGAGQGGQGRAPGQENFGAAHKAATDPAVINHGDGGEAGDMTRIAGRARYA